MDLLNEVLNIDFGQRAAKISEVKFGSWKKYLPTRPAPGAWGRTGQVDRYFFQSITLTSDTFASQIYIKTLISTFHHDVNSITYFFKAHEMFLNVWYFNKLFFLPQGKLIISYPYLAPGIWYLCYLCFTSWPVQPSGEIWKFTELLRLYTQKCSEIQTKFFKGQNLQRTETPRNFGLPWSLNIEN